VRVAERFAGRHRERISVLERKLTVQRDELALGEQELAEMVDEARRAAAVHPSDSVSAAWRDLESAGAARPGDDDRLRAETDRQRHERVIEEQLAYLKKKMGKR
jgi:hypothetical protein